MEKNITSESESFDKLQPVKVNDEKNDLKTESVEVIENIKSDCDKNSETVIEKKVPVKSKLNELKVYDDISLSEGELSKEFESFSSLISEGEIDDLDLSSLDNDGYDCNGDNFNVIIQIENELAFKSKKDDNGRTNWKNEKNIPGRHPSKTGKYLDDYTNKRHNGFRDYKDHKSWRNNIENYKYSRRDQRSDEREISNRKRSPTPKDYDRHRSTHSDRSKNGRRIDAISRSRRSKSNERTNRYRRSRSLEKNSRPRSPNYKDRKIERKHFNSFDVKTRRQSPTVYSKRKRSPLSSSPTSVWKRLDSRISPDRLKSRTRKPYNKPPRRKERTPFLVELERKLKEADIFTYTKVDTSKGPAVQKEVPMKSNETETVAVPEPVPPVNQIPIPPYDPTYVPPAMNMPNVVYPLQYPTLSVDNLPLVPGPNGLPVYVTITGEHIPHDMDGRRIPVGPNGYYLPLDPTGRLYAHIVSPGNQAVPIHMTDDGVLRLPNLDPVPFGPGHTLPVNVDGNYIPIGSDSKPLYPCLNLPREPPLHLLQMVNAGMNCQHTAQQPVLPMVPQPPLPPIVSQPAQPTVPPSPTPMVSEPPLSENQQSVQTKSKWIPTADISNGWDIFQPSNESLPLNNVPGKLFDKIPKTNASIKEKVWRRSEDGSIALVPNKTENNVIANTKSHEIGKRTAKDDASDSCCDMILDSCDSDYSVSSVRVTSNPKKDSYEEIQLSSDDETNCDNESTKAERKNAECDSKDAVAKKIHEAIKSLSEGNYKPPAFGRFILSKITKKMVKKLPNESPLLRNRVKLPFLTPEASSPANQTVTEDITFVFLSKKNPQKEEIPSSDINYDKSHEKNCKVSQMLTSTLDFAVQCDLTSDEITMLRFKVAKLESEVIRLKDLNMNLLDEFRKAQAENNRTKIRFKKSL